MAELVEMKLVSNVVRSYRKLGWRFEQTWLARNFSANRGIGNGNNGKESNGTPESRNDFEERIFGDSFFSSLDKIEKARGKDAGKFSSGSGDQNNHHMLDGLDSNENIWSDRTAGKLKKASRYFAFDEDILGSEDYKFRPDMSFPSGMDTPGLTYTIKDLDLTKPGVPKEFKRIQFETTTKEVLEKADFRNVRFLANFITAAGILKKRKMTGISAKAQRKIAREVKTARAFGLMPFTNMGLKPFRFGRSVKETYDDFNHAPFMRRGGPFQPIPRNEVESLDVDSLISPNLDDDPPEVPYPPRPRSRL